MVIKNWIGSPKYDWYTLSIKQIWEQISQDFTDFLNVIFNDNTTDKVVSFICTVDQTPSTTEDNQVKTRMDDDDDDTFLRYSESLMLSDLILQGVEAISKVYMINPQDDESRKRIKIFANGKIKIITDYVCVGNW